MNAIHPDDKEKVFKEWYKSTEARSNFKLDYRFVDKKGKVTWTIGQAVPMKNANNELFGFAGIITDITNHKQVEEKLKESEEKYRTITETIPGAVYECDLDWKFTFVSNGIEKLTGFPASDIINNNTRSFVSLIFDDDLKRINLSLDEAIKRKDKYYFSEYKLKTKSKETLWVHDSVAILYNSKGDTIGYKGVIIDITVQKLAEEKIRNTEKNLQNTFDLSPSIICTGDLKNNKVIDVNIAVTKSLIPISSSSIDICNEYSHWCIFSN